MSTIPQLSLFDGAICPICKIWVTSSGYRQKTMRKCVDCERAQCRAYYKSHKDAASERSRKWRQLNAEYNITRMAKWHEDHKDRALERNRQWRKENPEKRKVTKHRRYARQQNAKGSFTPEQWALLLSFYGNKCLCCGSSDDICADHVISLKVGGENTIENLQPLCRRCNSRKRTKHIDYRVCNIP